MKIDEVGRTGTWLRSALERADTARTARTPGLHLSEIVNDIAKILDPTRYAQAVPKDVRDAWFGIGLAIEDMLAEALRARFLDWRRPQPIRLDGIWLTPDGGTRTRTDEIKATWVSSRHRLDDPRLARYRWQLLAYMHARKTPHGRVYILHLNGDYKPPRPVFRVWDVTATDDDLRDNWSMIVNHAIDRHWLGAVDVVRRQGATRKRGSHAER